MTELLERARRLLHLKADIGHLCEREALGQALNVIERMSTANADANVAAVKRLLDERSARGLLKYGVPTSRAGLTHVQWLIHLREELLDAAIYITAALPPPPESEEPVIQRSVPDGVSG